MSLDKVESHTALFNSIHVGVKPNKDWSTIGVIDKYYPQSDFCVTRITDMRGAHKHLYVTGKAYTKYQEQLGMGSVIAIKRPFLLRPTEVTEMFIPSVKYTLIRVILLDKPFSSITRGTNTASLGDRTEFGFSAMQ